MKPDVFFSSLRNKKFNSPLDKIKKLMNRCGIKDIFEKEELIAIKTHFGEYGNTAFLRPIFLRPVVEILKKMDTKPYLAETNTLYVGMRTNSVDHLHNANLNGFNYSTLQIPAIIADGLRGENSIAYKIDKELCESVHLAADIINADGMVCVSHFKGHELTGFGGAIKNMSMGCASREGKMDMHSQSRPKVHQDKCTSCGRCTRYCAANAIEMTPKAYITEKCTGCARCIAACPEHIINISWDESSDVTQKKMAEYAYGTSKALDGKVIYLNLLTSISPACDCYPGNDMPVVHDIGFASSTDPVALDQACLDLVIKELHGVDPFKEIYPNIDSNSQLDHAEKIGLGKREYNLISID